MSKFVDELTANLTKSVISEIQRALPHCFVIMQEQQSYSANPPYCVIYDTDMGPEPSYSMLVQSVELLERVKTQIPNIIFDDVLELLSQYDKKGNEKTTPLQRRKRNDIRRKIC